MSEILTKEERLELQETFNIFDKNKDGTICINEIGAVMQAFGKNPTKAQLEKVIESVDANENGKFLRLLWLFTIFEPQKITSAKTSGL